MLGVPAKNENLHGNVPDESAVVLLLIDVINDFEFEGAEPLLENVLSIAPAIAALKLKAKQAKVAVIYVNDNFGKWQSDFRKLLEHCLQDQVKGKPVVELLQPQAEDYFVLKPKHSAFYATTLEVLLSYLKAKTLIITGLSGNSCVLFTANDAFMRDFNLLIPRDCVASATSEENEYALAQMSKWLKADTTPSTEIDFAALNRT